MLRGLRVEDPNVSGGVNASHYWPRTNSHGRRMTENGLCLLPLEEGEDAFSLALRTLVHFLLKLLHRLDDSAQNGSLEV